MIKIDENKPKIKIDGVQIGVSIVTNLYDTPEMECSHSGFHKRQYYHFSDTEILISSKQLIKLLGKSRFEELMASAMQEYWRIVENDISCRQHKDENEKDKKQLENGHIYLIKIGSKYKVGITKNWNQRFKFYKDISPDICVIVLQQASHPVQRERELLRWMWKNDKKRNEWFTEEEVDLKELKSKIEDGF